MVNFEMWAKPTFSSINKSDKNFKSNFHSAMMYAHYELSATDLKKEVVKYIKHIDPKHKLLSRISSMHENRFVTVGKYMYVLNHGGEIPDNIVPTLMPALEKVIYEEEAKAAETNKTANTITGKGGGAGETCAIPKVVISIQERLREKAREVSGEVEGWIDDFCLNKKLPVKTVDEFVTLFKTNNLKSQHMKYIRDAFENRAKEIEEVIEGNDKDLVEAYSNYSRVEIKKCDTFNKNLFKACDMLQEVAKADRAPRKKKIASVDKVISKLKYKKEDSSLGIASVNPTQLIGAQTVWTYNVKTRKLSQYRALDITGIQVKGASLTNYSPDSAEKTVRKPAEVLADFKKASKVKLRTFLKELSTVDVPCSGKLNEHHIILRIDK